MQDRTDFHYGASDHIGDRRLLLSGESLGVLRRNPTELLKLRNAHPAFDGKLEINETPSDRLHLARSNGGAYVVLEANLRSHNFRVTHMDGKGGDGVIRFSH